VNIDKFEYWAKRQGMSCVKFKDHKGGTDGYSTYTSDDTERAFLYWLDAFSPQVQSLFELQQDLLIKYKGVDVKNEFIIKATDCVLDEFFDLNKDLNWLYEFSTPTETDNFHVLQIFNVAKRTYKRNILELSELIELKDLFSWRTRDDYPKIRAKVSKALANSVDVVWSSGGLESKINEKLNGVILEKRGSLQKDSREYKFSENVVQLAIDLSRKEINENITQH